MELETTDIYNISVKELLSITCKEILLIRNKKSNL